MNKSTPAISVTRFWILVFYTSILAGCKANPSYATIDFIYFGENYYEFDTKRLAAGVSESEAISLVRNSKGEPISSKIYKKVYDGVIYSFKRYQANIGPDILLETLYLKFVDAKLASWVVVEGTSAPPVIWPDPIRSVAESDKKIYTGKTSISSGTGFFISDEGEILTACHVIDGADEVLVSTSDGREFRAEVLKKSRSNDLALLKIDASVVDYLPLKPASEVNLGLPVFTMGFPAGNILGKSVKYSDGAIASLTGAGDEQSLFQITIPVQPGNSGGPVVTEDGFVIGVVTSTAAVIPFIEETGALPQNINWGVKSEYALILSDQDPGKTPVDKSRALRRTEQSVCRITASFN